jgi:hypothetical protein
MNNMKRILFFFALLPYLATAQSGDTTKDSVSISLGADSVYYVNRWVAYEDGYELASKQPIGDSAQLVSYLAGKEVDAIRQHTYHAVQAMQKGRLIVEWQDVNTALKAVQLPGLDTLMQALFEGQFLGDAQVKIGTANFIPADVVKNSLGNIRLLFGSGGYRVILYADTMLRVVGYPATGQNTDLYKVRERVFRNMDNTFTLRLK